MTPTLHLTVGPPASGKTTWARKWVQADPEKRLRVNRDDTRTFLGYKHGENEPLVTDVQKAAVRAGLKSGRDVVVDDTNLVAKFAKEWLKVAAEFNARVEWHEEFLNVDPRVLVDRDSARDAKVGQDVILKMVARAKNWKRPTSSSSRPDDFSAVRGYTSQPGKPKTVLVDIDGTVALNGPDRDNPNRGWFDWDRVGEDLPNKPVIQVVQALYDANFTIMFVSGRTDEGNCRDNTQQWIQDNVGIYDARLIMRETNCGRKDSIVKLELFDKYIRNDYDVRFCIDDRDQVVRAYREVLGLTVLQVAYGDF